MNMIAKSGLNFHGIELQPVPEMDEVWLTANQIGYALQYADDKAVQRIYSRHADEFTENMTGVVKLTTPYGNQMTRAFSLRGAHLIAMFARTPVAKKFRRWVLDLIDREMESGNAPESLERLYTMQLSSSEMCSMAWLYKSAMHMREELEMLAPKLEVLKSPLYHSAHSLAANNINLLDRVKGIMAREVSKFDKADLAKDLNWGRVLPDLNIH